MLRQFLFVLGVLTSILAIASDEVTEIQTQLTSTVQDSVGIGNEQHIWGQGDNLNLIGFVANGSFHRLARTTDRVAIIRRDIAGISSGEPCGLFAEHIPDNPRRLIPGYASDNVSSATDTRNCSESVALMSQVINRGTLNTFSNRGGTRGNIERLDLIFDKGHVAPLNDDLTGSAGHIVGEKSGNNRVQLAAILALDSSGNPTSYGPLVRIGRVNECTATDLCYARTALTHSYSFFKNEPLSPQSDPILVGAVTEPVTFAFASLKRLGIKAGSIYFGVSVFADDVQTSTHDLLNPSGFPEDTEDADVSPGDSADLYGGLAGYYESDTVSSISGAVTCTADDTQPVPLIGWPTRLYSDQNANGVFEDQLDTLVSQLPGTGTTGDFSFSGLSPGTYFIETTAPSTVLANSTDTFVPDMERLQTIVLTEGQIQTLSFEITKGCSGPQANDDEVPFQPGNSIAIDVLLNDFDSSENPNSAELIIVSVSDSTTADISINGRAIVYTPRASFLALLSPTNPLTDTFTYQVTDNSGLTSNALVTVRMALPNDPPTDCPISTNDCFLVETEVEGIGIGVFSQALLFCLTGFAVVRLFKTCIFNGMVKSS